jgi:hypothetical protein
MCRPNNLKRILNLYPWYTVTVLILSRVALKLTVQYCYSDFSLEPKHQHRSDWSHKKEGLKPYAFCILIIFYLFGCLIHACHQPHCQGRSNQCCTPAPARRLSFAAQARANFTVGVATQSSALAPCPMPLVFSNVSSCDSQQRRLLRSWSPHLVPLCPASARLLDFRIQNEHLINQTGVRRSRRRCPKRQKSLHTRLVCYAHFSLDVLCSLITRVSRIASVSLFFIHSAQTFIAFIHLSLLRQFLFVRQEYSFIALALTLALTLASGSSNERAFKTTTSVR